MRLAVFALLGLSTTLLAAQDTSVHPAAAGIGKSPVEAKFSSGGQVRMELCSSGVELIGEKDDRVRVSYEADYPNAVKVRLEVSGDRADLRVSGCPHNNFQMMIQVPKSSDLYVRMFAGNMNIWGIVGDKDVSMSAGQLTMDVGNPDDYGHVRASVNTGGLEASAFDVSKGGLFRSFDKTGPGKYRLYAHVGAGQLELR
jgi:hypothetical protein